MNKDNTRKLYNALSEEYDLGDLATFESNIADSAKRRKLYDAISDSYDMGEYGAFEKQLGFVADETYEPDGADKETVAAPSYSLAMPTEEEKRNQYLAGQKSLQEMVDERKASSDGTKFVMPEGWSVDTSTNHGNTSWQTVGKSAKGLKEMRDKGQLDVLYNSEEEQRIDQQYKPRKVETVADIQSNYADRFAMTERGRQLGNELQQVEVSVTEKYYKDYAKTDEYRNMLAQARKKAEGAKTQEEVDAINKQFNEDVSERISALYGDQMQADVAPYRKAYGEAFMNRYGSRMEAETYQLNKDKSADELQVLSAKVDGLLDAWKIC